MSIAKVNLAFSLILFSVTALAKDWPEIVFFDPAPQLSEIRISDYVQPVMIQTYGPLAVRVGDTVRAGWRRSGDLDHLIDRGDYRKISLSSSIQWTEWGFRTEFYLAGSPCGSPKDCSDTPLLLDTSRNGFRLGEPGRGVSFDITSSGTPSIYQWVARGTDDGFLIRDLNGNGFIDDGSELFGNGTIIETAGVKASNGYDALAQYDKVEMGGNEDGFISKDDNVWEALKIWIDEDANGVSEASEIFTLSHFEIESFNLSFKRSKNRIDTAGNFLPYWSWVKTSSTEDPKMMKMIDVYFRKIQ